MKGSHSSAGLKPELEKLELQRPSSHHEGWGWGSGEGGA